MRRSTLFGGMFVAVFFALLVSALPRSAAQPPGTTRPPGSAPPGQGPPGQPGQRPPGMMGMAPAPDSMAAQRDSLMNAVLKKIAGHESQPAESVFKDIQVLKGFPADRVVRVMNMGFGRSLGVGCYHCHERDDWAKNEKRPKKVAREMWKMTGRINNELLANIEGLVEGNQEKPTVNCGTCHRGSIHVSMRRPPADSSRGGPPGR